MKHTARIRVNSTAHVTNNGRVHVHTTISNGRTTKTINKTFRAK